MLPTISSDLVARSLVTGDRRQLRRGVVGADRYQPRIALSPPPFSSLGWQRPLGVGASIRNERPRRPGARGPYLRASLAGAGSPCLASQRCAHAWAPVWALAMPSRCCGDAAGKSPIPFRTIKPGAAAPAKCRTRRPMAGAIRLANARA